MDKDFIIKGKYSYKSGYLNIEKKQNKKRPGKFSLTSTTKRDSTGNSADILKHANIQNQADIKAPINRGPTTSYVAKSSRTVESRKDQSQKIPAMHKLSKLTEKLNHETTRNSDLLISRMLSEMAENKTLSKNITKHLQVSRLLADRRRLSRFITEPSNMLLASDAQWSLKELDEVTNTEFWQMLERDRQKEKIRADVKNMVLRKASAPLITTTSDSQGKSMVQNYNHWGEQRLIRTLIQEDIEGILEEEDELSQKVLKRYKPSKTVWPL